MYKETISKALVTNFNNSILKLSLLIILAYSSTCSSKNEYVDNIKVSAIFISLDPMNGIEDVKHIAGVALAYERNFSKDKVLTWGFNFDIGKNLGGSYMYYTSPSDTTIYDSISGGYIG